MKIKIWNKLLHEIKTGEVFFKEQISNKLLEIIPNSFPSLRMENFTKKKI